MSIIAEFRLSCDAFPLPEMLSEIGGPHLEFEPILPTANKTLPFFRASGADVETLVEPLRETHAIESLTVVDSSDTTALFRVAWNDDLTDWLRNLVNETGVTPLSGGVTQEGWVVQLRAVEENQLSTCQQYCQETGVEIDLLEVIDTSDRDEENRYGLTPEQREALLLATAKGYFDTPREVTLEELADRLDISRQAFAGRLRRGHRNLIRNTIGDL